MILPTKPTFHSNPIVTLLKKHVRQNSKKLTVPLYLLLHHNLDHPVQHLLKMTMMTSFSLTWSFPMALRTPPTITLELFRMNPTMRLATLTIPFRLQPSALELLSTNLTTRLVTLPTTFRLRSRASGSGRNRKHRRVS